MLTQGSNHRFIYEFFLFLFFIDETALIGYQVSISMTIINSLYLRKL